MKKESKCGIYRIISPTKRIYIGQTTDHLYRWEQYKYCYEYNIAGSLLYKSLNKYGWKSHQFDIIEEVPEIQNQLDEREIYWIEYYKCNYKKYPKERGMNLTGGGNKPPTREIGYKLPDISKQKISDKNKKNWESGKYANAQRDRKKFITLRYYDNRANNINIGTLHIADTKLEYTVVPKGCSIESIEKEITATKDRECMIRSPKIYKEKKKTEEKIKKTKYVMSPERKEEIRQNKIGKKATEETRKRMSESQKKIWTPERREANSKRFKGRVSPMKGRKASPETIAKKLLKTQKPVIQIDISGNIVKEWASAVIAEREGGYSADWIGMCCKGKKERCKGYKWIFKKDYYGLDISR